MSHEGEAELTALQASCLSSPRVPARAAMVAWVRGEHPGRASSSIGMGLQSLGLSPAGGVMLYLVG